MPPGPSAVKAMQRLARILAVLDDAGVVGATAERLLEVAEYGGQAAPGPAQPGPAQPPQAGLADRQRGAPGEAGPLPDGERRQPSPRQAVAHPASSPPACGAPGRAGRPRQAPRRPTAAVPEGIGSIVIRKQKGDKLSLALQAVQLRSRIRFSYKGTPRLVHPGTVRFQNYKWYLSGVEDGADLVKHFVVSQMSDVALDPPGTAAEVPRCGASPCTRCAGRSTRRLQVTLRTTRDFVPDVVRWLNEPDSQVERDGVGRPDLHRHPPTGLPRPPLRPRSAGHDRPGRRGVRRDARRAAHDGGSVMAGPKFLQRVARLPEVLNVLSGLSRRAAAARARRPVRGRRGDHARGPRHLSRPGVMGLVVRHLPQACPGVRPAGR